MKDHINYQAIANFIATMDKQSSRTINLYNAEVDAWLYGWSWQTRDALFFAINDIYDRKMAEV